MKTPTEIYRVTRKGITPEVKICSKTSVSAQIGAWKSHAYWEGYHGRQPRYIIAKIERAQVSDFDDVTAEFLQPS